MKKTIRSYLKPYNDLDTPRTKTEVDPEGKDVEHAKELQEMIKEKEIGSG